MERKGPGFIINCWHFTLLCLLDLLFHFLNRVEVVGKENRPQRGEGSVLILSNHISALDPLLIGSTGMPRFSPVWWRAAAKEELFESFLSHWIVRSIGAFPVKRRQRDQASKDLMVESLKTDVLVVFPEGTWSTTGKLLPGRLGVGKIVMDAKPSKILPVAIRGTDNVLPRGSFIPRVGRKMQIVYGPPVDMRSFYEMEDSEETHRQIVEVIMKKIGALIE